MFGVSYTGAYLGTALVGNALDAHRHETYTETMKSLESDDAKAIYDLQSRKEFHQHRAGITLMQPLLAIGSYTGLAKLMGPKASTFRPRFAGRSPMSVPYTMAATGVAFLLGPLLNLSGGLSKQASLKACAGDCVRLDGSNEDEHAIASSHGAQAVANNSNSTKSECAVSVGSKYGPALEKAFPGHMTLFIPVLEEILFRGQFFSRLVPCIGVLPAALCSSVVFGASHVSAEPNVPYVPVVETFLGLAFSAGLYATGGRLVVPVALHSGANVFFILSNCLSSCPKTVGEQWLVSRPDSNCPMELVPQVSFWERQFANHFHTIDRGLTLFLDATQLLADAAAPEEAPFLPLEFCDKQCDVSPSSFFFDEKTNAMVRAPRFCVDGSLTPLAKALIEFGYLLHKAEDEECLFAFSKRHNSLYAMLHDAAGNTGLFSADTSSCQEEVMLDLGWMLLRYRDGHMSKADFEGYFEDYIRCGMFSHANRDLFVFYRYYLAYLEMSLSEASGCDSRNIFVDEACIKSYLGDFETGQVPPNLQTILDEIRRRETLP